jgi:hypothetical protein
VRLGTPILIKKEIIEGQANTNHFYEGDKYYKGDSAFFDHKTYQDFSL